MAEHGMFGDSNGSSCNGETAMKNGEISIENIKSGVRA